MRTTEGSTCLATDCKEELSCSSGVAANVLSGPEPTARALWADAPRVNSVQQAANINIERNFFIVFMSCSQEHRLSADTHICSTAKDNLFSCAKSKNALSAGNDKALSKNTARINA